VQGLRYVTLRHEKLTTEKGKKSTRVLVQSRKGERERRRDTAKHGGIMLVYDTQKGGVEKGPNCSRREARMGLGRN